MSGASVVTRSTSLTRHCQTSRAFHCWQRSVNGTSTTMRSTSVIRRLLDITGSSLLLHFNLATHRFKPTDHLPVPSAAGAVAGKSALLIDEPRMVFGMDAQRDRLIPLRSRP